MICSSVNRDRFIVRLPCRGGLYPNLEEFAGLTSGDMNIRPPASEEDEAAFLRLTGWCYVLLFEAGRVSIPFLLELRGGTLPLGSAGPHIATRKMVQGLRTALSHNLGFQSNHELEIRKAVSVWFLETCQEVVPSSAAAWRTCFVRLCNDVVALLNYCSTMLSSVATSVEDRDNTFDSLRRRLSLDWPAHEFDALIEDAAARLGEKINARSFRDPRLPSWRRFLGTLPQSADPRLEMERLIDGEVAEHFRSVLPIRTNEIMQRLNLTPGPRVKAAVEMAKRIHESGIREREMLLKRLEEEFSESRT